MATKSELIKSAYEDDDLTPEQLREFIKCAESPFYFLKNYVKVQHPTKGAVLFNLYPYQDRVLSAIMDNDKIIVMQPRQSGKSALVSAYLLWEAIFNENMNIGIAAHKGSGAKELLTRVKYAYECLPDWMKPGVKAYNVFDIEFDNGSKIVSETTTGNTFRGKSMSIIYLDELAFVPLRITEEFWASLLPSLSAGASDPEGRQVKLICTSTPNGSEGLFASEWFKAEQGTGDFYPVRVHNEEVPGRDEAFKQKALKTMSLTKYRQEYGCLTFETTVTVQLEDGTVKEVPIGRLFEEL